MAPARTPELFFALPHPSKLRHRKTLAKVSFASKSLANAGVTTTV